MLERYLAELSMNSDMRMSSQFNEFRVELVKQDDQDTVKLMVTALGKGSRCRTRIALDLVHDASDITRPCLIES